VRAYLSALLTVTGWKLALALALTVGQALTEGAGLLLVLPLLRLLGVDVGQPPAGPIGDLVASAVGTMGLRPTLPLVLGVYVAITGAYALLTRWQTIASVAIQYTFVADLRRRLYRAIAGASWLFLSRRRGSDFTHVLTTELDRVGVGTYHLLTMISGIVLTAFYLVMALALSPALTALVGACGGVLALLLGRHTRSAHQSGEALSAASKGLTAVAVEHLAAMKTAKSYGAQDRSADIFSRLASDVARKCVAAVDNQATVKCGFDVGAVVIVSLIIYLSIETLHVQGGVLLLMIFLSARLIPRVASLLGGYQRFLNTLPAFEAVVQMQAHCADAAEAPPGRHEAVELRRSIRLDGVSFAYGDQGDGFVVSGLDLDIRAGQMTAIVGESGAGKSTLADLLLGLIVPQAGRVLIDDRPLTADRMAAWREHIGYVAQDVFLFHDTIRANLLWARPESSEEAIHDALRRAAADEFVSRLPDGLETIIGDRGVRLSGGERQRLALARALLRKPALLILDEATSHLDADNEARILSTIESVRGHTTVLVITHRLASLRGADVIHVLKDGRLVASGDWQTVVGRDQAVGCSSGVPYFWTSRKRLTR
jgi:ATP-binding cassette, subfamily C, bacterial